MDPNDVRFQKIKSACEAGDFNEFKSLIKDTDKPIYFMTSAVKGGNVEIVKSLLERGAKVYSQRLYSAVVNGNLHLIDYLIDKARKPVYVLYGAATTSNWDLIKKYEHLVDDKILLYSSKDIEVFKYFLNKGYKPDEWVLMMAVEHKSYDVIDILIPMVSRYDHAVISATKNDDLALVDRFLKLGAKTYNVYLNAAAEYHNIAMIEKFIKLGATTFDSAMKHAIDRETTDMSVIEFLLEKGANDYNEFLKRSVMVGRLDLVEKFIKLGANDLSVIDFAKRPDIVEYLIKLGAKEFRTCFYKAVFGERMSIVELLLKNGFDPTSDQRSMRVIKRRPHLGITAC